MNKTHYSKKDVKLIAKKRVYQGHFALDEYTLSHKKFDGSFSDPLTREVFKPNEAVALLPYDPKTKEVILIEQFRAPLFAVGEDPWLYEIIAGTKEINESIEAALIRETQEESGLSVHTLEKMFSCWLSPGGSSERIHIYCGVVDANAARGVHGSKKEGEDILVHRIKIDEALKAVEEGVITNAIVLLALQWFALNKMNHK